MPVRILMKSGGGDWIGALSIYDAIVDCDTLVTIEVYGQCMSGAVVIAQACDERLLHPNAVVMVHNGTHSGEGESQTFETWGKYAKAERTRMYNLLATKSKKDAAYWRRRCARGDYIMDADKAVELGLFDGVIRRDDV